MRTTKKKRTTTNDGTSLLHKDKLRMQRSHVRCMIGNKAVCPPLYPETKFKSCDRVRW